VGSKPGERRTASDRRDAAKAIGRPKATDRPPGYTRARLIEAATEVFAERGYEKASLTEIARRADVTSATIYRHFESKEDLFFAMVLATEGVLTPSGAGDGTAAPLPRIARSVSQFASSEASVLRRLAVEIHVVASRSPEVGRVLREFNARQQKGVAARLEQGVEDGRFPDTLDVERTTVLAFVMMAGLAHLDTVAPHLVGDPQWIRFIESSIEDTLNRSSWQRP